MVRTCNHASDAWLKKASASASNRLPDPNPPSLDSGRLPETPLYPALRTNTPHPTSELGGYMLEGNDSRTDRTFPPVTIPHWPFRPLTALFPHHESVLQYHEDVVRNFSLESHLRLNSEVVEARWADHHWNLHIEDHSTNASASTSRKAEFDHLIVATGHNHYPYEPEFDGRRTWEEADSSRRVVHSIFFRDPADFAGKNVLVVGGGASGRDSTQQIVWHANSVSVRTSERMLLPTCLSYRHTSRRKIINTAVSRRSRISQAWSTSPA